MKGTHVWNIEKSKRLNYITIYIFLPSIIAQADLYQNGYVAVPCLVHPIPWKYIVALAAKAYHGSVLIPRPPTPCSQ